jgi:hypothetical protein
MTFPDPTTLSRLSCAGCPTTVVLSQLSCLCCHVLAILSSMPCPGWRDPADLSCRAVPVLSRLSCPGCSVHGFPSKVVLDRLFCPSSPLLKNIKIKNPFNFVVRLSRKNLLFSRKRYFVKFREISRCRENEGVSFQPYY